MNWNNVKAVSIDNKEVKKIVVNGEIVFPKINYINWIGVGSSNNNYILLDYAPNNNTSVEISVANFSETAKARRFVFGAERNWNSRLMDFYINFSDNLYHIYKFGNSPPTTNNSDIQFAFQMTDANFHTFKFDKLDVSVDGELIKQFNDYGDFQSPVPFAIFTRNRSGGFSEYAINVKIAYIKIWDNGVLVRDLKPIKDDDTGLYGLYCVLTNKKFIATGTRITGG